MSTESNTILLERASDMIDYWPGTLHERILTHLIDTNDFEGLMYAVANAENEQAIQEDHPLEPEEIGGIAGKVWIGRKDVF